MKLEMVVVGLGFALLALAGQGRTQPPPEFPDWLAGIAGGFGDSGDAGGQPPDLSGMDPDMLAAILGQAGAAGEDAPSAQEMMMMMQMMPLLIQISQQMNQTGEGATMSPADAANTMKLLAEMMQMMISNGADFGDSDVDPDVISACLDTAIELMDMVSGLQGLEGEDYVEGFCDSFENYAHYQDMTQQMQDCPSQNGQDPTESWPECPRFADYEDSDATTNSIGATIFLAQLVAVFVGSRFA